MTDAAATQRIADTRGFAYRGRQQRGTEVHLVNQSATLHDTVSYLESQEVQVLLVAYKVLTIPTRIGYVSRDLNPL